MNDTPDTTSAKPSPSGSENKVSPLPSARLIYRLLPRVAKDIGAIAKSRQGQGYKFRGIDDVLNSVHGPLCEHGVFLTTKVTDVSREERETKSGGSITYTRLMMETTFWAEDGSSVSTITAGEAMDVSDKSTNKAMSAALKYAMFQTFTIPLEESEVEDDSHEPRPAAPKAAPQKPAATPVKPDPRAAHPQFGRLMDTVKQIGAKSDEQADKIIAWAGGTSRTACWNSEALAEKTFGEIDAKCSVGGMSFEDARREALGVPDNMSVPG